MHADLRGSNLDPRKSASIRVLLANRCSHRRFAVPFIEKVAAIPFVADGV